LQFQTAMKSYFEKEGYEAFATHESEKVVQYLNNNLISTLFVDCLLPGLSGVDFIEKIRKKFPPAVLEVVLMSGLFKDASFERDALRATKAIGFLKKPFDLEHALSFVKPTFNQVSSELENTVSPREALYGLFSKEKVSHRDKRKVIEALDEVHGFDLPYIYSLMVESKNSGHLNLVNSKNELSSVSFCMGNVIGVDIADNQSRLGSLLIESGYLLKEDLDTFLQIESSKKLGERLILGSVLSPHAFNIVLMNQMSIRLSRTINEAKYKINFVSTDVDLTEPHIDSQKMTYFLHDWITSKLTKEWLVNNYLQLGNQRLRKASQFTTDHSILSLPLMSHFSGVIDEITNGKTLSEIFENTKFSEEIILRAMHLLLCKGLLIFQVDAKVDQSMVQNRIRFLNKLFVQIDKKHPLEIYDVVKQLTNFTENSTLKMIESLKSMMGAEPEPSLQPEVYQLYIKILKIVDEMARVVGDNPKALKEELERQELTKKMNSTQALEEIRQYLDRSMFPKALEVVNKIEGKYSHLEKIAVYKIWAKLGIAETKENKSALLKEVETDFMQVPPEERFESIYHFVSGLKFKLLGDYINAKQSFEKATQIDSSSLAVKRELQNVQRIIDQKKDVLNRDLKDLVSGFFKKK